MHCFVVVYPTCQGVIHRDVKPRNFLYARKARTGLLIDFGLAQVAPNDGGIVAGARKRTQRRDLDGVALPRSAAAAAPAPAAAAAAPSTAPVAAVPPVCSAAVSDGSGARAGKPCASEAVGVATSVGGGDSGARVGSSSHGQRGVVAARPAGTRGSTALRLSGHIGTAAGAGLAPTVGGAGPVPTVAAVVDAAPHAVGRSTVAAGAGAGASAGAGAGLGGLSGVHVPGSDAGVVGGGAPVCADLTAGRESVGKPNGATSPSGADTTTTLTARSGAASASCAVGPLFSVGSDSGGGGGSSAHPFSTSAHASDGGGGTAPGSGTAILTAADRGDRTRGAIVGVRTAAVGVSAGGAHGAGATAGGSGTGTKLSMPVMPNGFVQPGMVLVGAVAERRAASTRLAGASRRSSKRDGAAASQQPHPCPRRMRRVTVAVHPSLLLTRRPLHRCRATSLAAARCCRSAEA